MPEALGFVIRLVFGWPFILSAIFFIALGISWRRAHWTALGTVLALPFSLYLVATPLFRLSALILPALLAGSVIAVRQNKTLLAWLLAVPFFGVAAWFAYEVVIGRSYAL